MAVNQTLAQTLWPGQNAVGQMVTQNGGRRVVGVVADVRHAALGKAGGSEMYIPLRQTRDYPSMELVVRTSVPPDTIAAGIRAALRRVDPNLPIGEFRTLQGLGDRAVSPRRFLVLLLAGFAGFALLLASLGIYAVVSYSVSRRVQEIGISDGIGSIRRGCAETHSSAHAGIGCLGAGVGNGSRTRSVERAREPVVWNHGRRSSHFRGDGRAADRRRGCCCVHSRMESFPDRPPGRAAVKLNRTQEGIAPTSSGFSNSSCLASNHRRTLMPPTAIRRRRPGAFWNSDSKTLLTHDRPPALGTQFEKRDLL